MTHTPRPTQRTAYSSTRGSLAWCPTCQKYLPSAQVAWGKELRNKRGEITATYAAIPHIPESETSA